MKVVEWSGVVEDHVLWKYWEIYKQSRRDKTSLILVFVRAETNIPEMNLWLCRLNYPNRSLVRCCSSQLVCLSSSWSAELLPQTAGLDIVFIHRYFLDNLSTSQNTWFSLTKWTFCIWEICWLEVGKMCPFKRMQWRYLTFWSLGGSSNEFVL